MASFDLTPGLNVGIPEIDSTLPQISDLLARLSDFNSTERDIRELLGLVNGLIGRLELRFVAENEYLEKSDATSREVHRVEHERYCPS